MTIVDNPQPGSNISHLLRASSTPSNGVARLEEHSNLLLFTLRRAVKAMGGKLSLIAEYPNRPPVVLLSFSEYELAPRQRTLRKARPRS